MRKAKHFGGLFAKVEPEFHFLVALVHNNYNDLPVGVLECRGKQLRPVGGADDPFSTWLDILGKMSDVVVGIHVM